MEGLGIKMKQTLKLTGRGYLLYLAISLVCALTVLSGGAVFGIIIGAALYVAYVLLMYSDGASEGEHACSVSDTIAKLRSENAKVPPELLQNAYDRKHGLRAFIACTLPFLLLAVLNIIFADNTKSSETTLGIITRFAFFPQLFITRWCSESIKYDISGTMQAVKSVLGAFKTYGQVDAQALTLPGQGAAFAAPISLKPLMLMRILYIPSCILPGLALYIGYLMGPKLRKKTVDEMMKGSRRKLRRMRKNKNRQARSLKPEI